MTTHDLNSTPQSQRFKDKIVVVIGGNSGIGLACALRYQAEGAHVAICGRNAETVIATGIRLGEGGFAAVADMRDGEAIDGFLDEVVSRYGRIDILFVNAGVGWFSKASEISRDRWDYVVETNLSAAFFASQRAIPAMPRGSAIVFTSSAGSRVAVPGNVAYAASKAGLRAAARIMALELAEAGIRVNVVSPGGIETPIMQRDQGIDPGSLAEIGANFMKSVPLGRIGSVEEVASAVLYLSSDEASYITGVDLFIDGGIATP